MFGKPRNGAYSQRVVKAGLCSSWSRVGSRPVRFNEVTHANQRAL